MTLANDLEKNWKRGKARMNRNREGDLLYNKNMMKTGSQWNGFCDKFNVWYQQESNGDFNPSLVMITNTSGKPGWNGLDYDF